MAAVRAYQRAAHRVSADPKGSLRSGRWQVWRAPPVVQLLAHPGGGVSLARLAIWRPRAWVSQVGQAFYAGFRARAAYVMRYRLAVQVLALAPDFAGLPARALQVDLPAAALIAARNPRWGQGGAGQEY